MVDWSNSSWDGVEIPLYLELKARSPPLTLDNIDPEITLWKTKRRVSINPSHTLFLPPLVDEPDFIALLVVDWSFVATKGSQRSMRLHLSREHTSLGGIEKYQTICIHFDAPNQRAWAFHHHQISNRVTPGFD